MNFPKAVLYVVSVLVAVAFMVLGFGSVLILQARDQSRINAQTLEILLATSSCTVKDTPEQCRKRQTDKSAAEGLVRIAEVDCRQRLALAGKPSPEPGQTCAK